MNWRKWIFFVLLVVALAMAYFYWQTFLKTSTPEEAAEEYLKNYQELMKADSYGGQTPEETLQLFIDALKKEDMDLASKYFLLDDEGKRDKWVAYLLDLKDKGQMQKLAEDLGRAKAGIASYEADYTFEVFNEDGTVGVSVDMELNELSGVWKIESL